MGHSARETLVAIAIKNKGDWNRIVHDLDHKIQVEEEYFEKLKDYEGEYGYITLLDDNYPQQLKETPFAPVVLFYKGNVSLLNSDRIISVIGTREPTDYGRAMTNKIVKGLAEEDFVICSGLARGIDSFAHKTALENNAATIAVIGNGINKYYPLKNRPLYDEIIDFGGLIISEYPFDVEPTQDKFGKRNRIVAGLSKGIVIIEAFKNSGTLITTKYGLNMGKDIYCVPDRAGHDSVCNNLIKQGAKLVESYQDIVSDLFNNV